MNYSTLKKTVGLSFVSLIVVGMASAQTNTMSTTKMSDSVTTAKLFGGVQQYNTLSVGVNVGVTAPFVATGGTNVFNGDKAKLGYGVSIRDQFSHAFSLKFDLNGGQVGGSGAFAVSNPASPGGNTETVSVTSFTTNYWQGAISAVVNIGNIDFLQRKSLINFYGSAGFGIVAYAPTIYFPDASGLYGKSYNFKGTFANGTETYIHELVIPVGIGVKFKLSDKLDLNIGYTENFVDGYNFEGVKEKFPAKNKYSYGYGGLEYTFGPKSKPSLEWVNPVAIMYDELYDAALRQEVQALKGRVKNVEAAIADLKKDSDGDGVADQFDKCPNTPAGTTPVDGSGCPIVFPKPVVDSTGGDDKEEVEKKEVEMAKKNAQAYANIEFEFDSSVLKATSYPVLDLTIADMKKSGKKITIAGYASSEGTSAYNMRLSKDRANSVKTYFLNSGVPAKQVKIKGYGETHPIADNSTEAGRILNRRVEFKK